MSARTPIVIGQAPTDADEFWIGALGKETPDQTIARLDKYGQYLFSLTATIATVLTGFSLFKADSLASSRAFWLLLPVAMFAIGLGLASLGLRPRPAEVNRHDSNAIRAYYHALILRRGRYLSAAGIAFALGLFLVPLALALASPRVIGSLGVKLEKSEKAEQGHTVTAKLDLTQVPAGARARLAVMAGAEPVAVQSGGPDSAGKVAFQVTAKGAGPHRVEGVVEAGGEVLFRQETSVP